MVIEQDCGFWSVSGEFNYLPNPLRPYFSKLRTHGPEEFPIDKRFMR